jgi:glycerol-3-phosphate dehydrogenase
VSCSAVVNATGVWADDVRAIDEGTHPDTIRPAKGIHITVPWELVRNDIAVVIPVPKDRRSVFVVPWHVGGAAPRFTYVGTTDTDYHGPLEDPECTPADVAYLLDALNASLTTTVTEADILGTWAGLRPLVKSSGSARTADLSRRHRIGTSPSGMVTVTGGKLTTYREMAAQTIDEAVRQLGSLLEGRTVGRSRTKRLRLRGAAGYAQLKRSGAAGPLGATAVAELADRYGGEARVLLAMVEHDASLGEALVEGLPNLAAEAVYAARYEMACSVTDVLARRTRAHLLDARACAGAADAVAALLAPELGWSAEEAHHEAEAYRELVAREQAAPELPGAW